MSDLFLRSSAVLSDCGRHRYRLDRAWRDGPVMGFIMLNPSTADDAADDPTIRRCKAFAQREGCGALIVVNLYSFRATKPADLWAQDALARQDARTEIEFHKAIAEMDIAVAAWGADTRRAEHWIEQRFSDRLMCLGRTKDGRPRHPLYVRGDAPLVPLFKGVAA